MKISCPILRRERTSYHRWGESGQGRKMKSLFKAKSPKGRTPRCVDGSFPAAQNNWASTELEDTLWEENESRDDYNSSSVVSRSRKRSNKKRQWRGRTALSPISETCHWHDESYDEERDGPASRKESSFDFLPVCEESSWGEEENTENDHAGDVCWAVEWDPYDLHSQFSTQSTPNSFFSNDRDTTTTESVSIDEFSNLADLSKSSSSTEKRRNKTDLLVGGAQKDKTAGNVEQSIYSTNADIDSADPKAVEKELQARLEVIHALKNIILHQGETVAEQRAVISKYKKKVDEGKKVIKRLHRQQILFKERISHLELEVELHEAKAMWSKEELQTVRAELHDLRAALAENDMRLEQRQEYGTETVVGGNRLASVANNDSGDGISDRCMDSMEGNTNDRFMQQVPELLKSDKQDFVMHESSQ